MKTYQFSGKLDFHPRLLKDIYATCSGKIYHASRQFTQDNSATRMLFRLYSREFIEAQEMYIHKKGCNPEHEPDHRFPLENYGLSEREIYNLQCGSKPQKYLSLSCPAQHYNSQIPPHEAKVSKGAFLFTHGPRAIEAEIPEVLAAHLGVHHSALARPKDWPESELGTRRSLNVAVCDMIDRGFPPGNRRVFFAIDNCPDYPLRSEFVVSVNFPSIPDDFEYPRRIISPPPVADPPPNPYHRGRQFVPGVQERLDARGRNLGRTFANPPKRADRPEDDGTSGGPKK